MSYLSFAAPLGKHPKISQALSILFLIVPPLAVGFNSKWRKGRCKPFNVSEIEVLPWKEHAQVGHFERLACDSTDHNHSRNSEQQPPSSLTCAYTPRASEWLPGKHQLSKFLSDFSMPNLRPLSFLKVTFRFLADQQWIFQLLLRQVVLSHKCSRPNATKYFTLVNLFITLIILS